MPTIIPAILEKTKETFLQKLFLVCKIPGVERIQVDFGDGEFIENKLLEAGEMDTLNPAFHWEAHLMVQSPNDFLDYQICGFKTLIVHCEAFPSVDDLVTSLQNIKSLGLKAGVAINPATPVKVLAGIKADQYLIMSVIPGKQGQSFIENTLNKAKELRKLIPGAIIEVDGGVNLANINSIAQADIDLIVAGSAVLSGGKPAENFEKLKVEMNKNQI